MSAENRTEPLMSFWLCPMCKAEIQVGENVCPSCAAEIHWVDVESEDRRMKRLLRQLVKHAEDVYVKRAPLDMQLIREARRVAEE